MKNHPATDDLRRWQRGEVGEDEMIAIAEHLSVCDDCIAAAPRLGLARAAIDLCDEIEDAGGHPAVEQDLFAFVDGTATADQRHEIAEHIALCTFCNDIVSDLRILAADRQKPRFGLWLLALAASVVIAVVAGVRSRMMPPPPLETRRIARAAPAPSPIDETETFARTIRHGARIPMPERLRSVLGEADVLRGTSAATGTFQPAGVLVTSARPLFIWPAPPDASSIVEVFSGENEVMRSRTLGTHRWHPARDLPRGITYTWTVRIEHGGTVQILPAAPSPVARFHVLDGATFEALQAAERRYTDDHFLLGVLYARAGVEDAARAHLRLVTDPVDAGIARRVLHDIDSWHARPR